jgi:hypothetical protein
MSKIVGLFFFPQNPELQFMFYTTPYKLGIAFFNNFNNLHYYFGFYIIYFYFFLNKNFKYIITKKIILRKLLLIKKTLNFSKAWWRTCANANKTFSMILGLISNVIGKLALLKILPISFNYATITAEINQQREKDSI